MPPPAVILEQLTPIVPAGADVEATIAFYQRALGFVPVYRSGSPTAAAIVERDGVRLFLQRNPDRHVLENAAYLIRVRGVAAFHEEIARREPQALHPHAPLRRREYGGTEFSVIDPNGVCFTFFEFLP